jgi:RNA polymerase sigma factor (TIGR02999 family)
MPEPEEITAILAQARGGDRSALDEVFSRVHAEIHRIAHRQIARVPAGASLNTTAVVNEAYLKLVRSPQLVWEDRAHFYAVAAMAMRQILLNHARARSAQKRGGGPTPVWRTGDGSVEAKVDEFLRLDAALGRLRELDGRMAQVVDLRYFAGLSVEETADVLQVTERTVRRDWRTARAFLFRELGGSSE